MCVFGVVMKNRSEGIDFGFGIKQAIGEPEVKHVSKCYWTKEEFSDLSDMKLSHDIAGAIPLASHS